MKNHHHIAILALSIMAATGLYFWQNEGPQSQSSHLNPITVQKDSAATAKPLVSQGNSNVAVANLPLGASKAVDYEPIAVAITEFKQGYINLFEVNTNIDRQVLQKNILVELAKNVEVVDLAIKIAGNPNKATKLYGEKQPQARVASIMLLNHIADAGDIEPLEQAINMTGERLHSDEWVKGIEHDYSDMIAGYTRAYFDIYGVDTFVDNFDVVLNLAHHSGKTSREFIMGLELSRELKNLSEEQLQVLRDKVKEHLDAV